MGRLILVARMAGAPCSPSTLMGRLLRPCTVSRQLRRIPTTTEPIRRPIWFYRATLCLERATEAAPTIPAPCSPSTPTGRVLESCIVFRHFLLPLVIPILTEPVCSLV